MTSFSSTLTYANELGQEIAHVQHQRLRGARRQLHAEKIVYTSENYDVDKLKLSSLIQRNANIKYRIEELVETSLIRTSCADAKRVAAEYYAAKVKYCEYIATKRDAWENSERRLKREHGLKTQSLEPGRTEDDFSRDKDDFKLVMKPLIKIQTADQQISGNNNDQEHSNNSHDTNDVNERSNDVKSYISAGFIPRNKSQSIESTLPFGNDNAFSDQIDAGATHVSLPLDINFDSSKNMPSGKSELKDTNNDEQISIQLQSHPEKSGKHCHDGNQHHLQNSTSSSPSLSPRKHLPRLSSLQTLSLTNEDQSRLSPVGGKSAITSSISLTGTNANTSSNKHNSLNDTLVHPREKSKMQMTSRELFVPNESNDILQQDNDIGVKQKSNGNIQTMDSLSFLRFDADAITNKDGSSNECSSSTIDHNVEISAKEGRISKEPSHYIHDELKSGSTTVQYKSRNPFLAQLSQEDIDTHSSVHNKIALHSIQVSESDDGRPKSSEAISLPEGAPESKRVQKIIAGALAGEGFDDYDEADNIDTSWNELNFTSQGYSANNFKPNSAEALRQSVDCVDDEFDF